MVGGGGAGVVLRGVVFVARLLCKFLIFLEIIHHQTWAGVGRGRYSMQIWAHSSGVVLAARLLCNYFGSPIK